MKILNSLMVLCFVLSFVVIQPRVWGSDASDLYKGKCSSCHGKSGEGAPMLAKAFKVDAAKLVLKSAATQKLTNEQLLKVISDGKGKMPAYKNKLKEDEIKQLVEFVHTFKP